MDIDTFIRRSEKLGYNVKCDCHKWVFFDYDCTIVIDKNNHKVASILEDRRGSYELSTPAPKSAECTLIHNYAYTPLVNRRKSL